MASIIPSDWKYREQPKIQASGISGHRLKRPNSQGGNEKEGQEENQDLRHGDAMWPCGAPGDASFCPLHCAGLLPWLHQSPGSP